ncbi:MAG: hypothetical protein K0Q50_1408 [Vampirovibrio sp.]|jgi:hypothetical protein|nr:hypothetical protein [Vampirovibrio sp.]
MGDMWFNGLFSGRNTYGLNAQGVNRPDVASGGLMPFSLSGTFGLNDALAFGSTKELSVIPQKVTPDQVNVPGLVRSAVAKDPRGLSLSPETLAFLQDAPLDISQFGLD